MFSFIVITPEKKLPKEHETILSLLEEGLKILHLRKPDFTEEELRDYLQKIPRKFHRRIVIHSHYNLISEFTLKGVHLTEKARKLNTRKLKVVSTSFHSTEEILKSRRKYDYVFLSPIFDSISKQGYKSRFTLEELRPLLKRRKNVIALGGVNDKNIQSLKQAGFAGAAVLGAVWESKNPLNKYTELALKIK